MWQKIDLSGYMKVMRQIGPEQYNRL